jgi:hypothetical protein
VLSVGGAVGVVAAAAIVVVRNKKAMLDELESKRCAGQLLHARQHQRAVSLVWADPLWMWGHKLFYLCSGCRKL